MVAYTFTPEQVAGIVCGMQAGSLVLVVGSTAERTQTILDGMTDAGLLQVARAKRTAGKAELLLDNGTRIIGRSTPAGVRGISAQALVTEYGAGADAYQPAILATGGTHLRVALPQTGTDTTETEQTPNPETREDTDPEAGAQ